MMPIPGPHRPHHPSHTEPGPLLSLGEAIAVIVVIAVLLEAVS